VEVAEAVSQEAGAFGGGEAEQHFEGDFAGPWLLACLDVVTDLLVIPSARQQRSPRPK